MSYIGVQPCSPLAFWQHGNTKGMGARGLSAYENSGDWTWEFDPFVYSFLAPADSAQQPAPIISGFSGCGDKCGCGGKCGGHGMWQASTGLFGTNLFTTTDFSQWGWGEWTVLAVGAWGTLRIIGDIKGAGKSVAKRVRKTRKRAAKVSEGLFG